MMMMMMIDCNFRPAAGFPNLGMRLNVLGMRMRESKSKSDSESESESESDSKS